MTRLEAKALRVGTTLHHNTAKNVDGTCVRWKINGQIKLWKTRPADFSVPIKHGLRDFGYLTQDNCHLLHTIEQCEVGV